MAKKSMIAREKKRKRLVDKYCEKRNEIKELILNASSLEQRLEFHRKLQQLPRNSSITRLHNRCQTTGRPKGYYRYFVCCLYYRHQYQKKWQKVRTQRG